MLEIRPIKYETNDAANLYLIDFKYSYQIKIAGALFGVVGRYNSRAEAVFQILI